ncbi:MAG: hypothetical protein GY793_11075 [Proteobacteria bacterium]|nr:hypothetical protein [Pseudomonadota bacterium]
MKTVNFCLYGYITEETILKLAEAFNANVVKPNEELGWTVNVFGHFWIDPSIKMRVKTRKYANFIKGLETQFSESYKNVCGAKVEKPRKSSAIPKIPDTSKPMSSSTMWSMFKSMKNSTILSKENVSGVTIMIHVDVFFEKLFLLDNLLTRKSLLYVSGREKMAGRVGQVISKQDLPHLQGTHLIFGGDTDTMVWFFTEETRFLNQRMSSGYLRYSIEVILVNIMLNLVKRKSGSVTVMNFIIEKGTFGPRRPDGSIFCG